MKEVLVVPRRQDGRKTGKVCCGMHKTHTPKQTITRKIAEKYSLSQSQLEKAGQPIKIPRRS